MIHYLRVMAARLRGLFGDRRADRELSDEIESHLRLLTERYVRQGMSEDEAARAARRQFGNVTLLKEVDREMRRIRLIDTLVQDLRFGARMLLKHRGFTAVAVLSLSLGVGANTAVFSLADAFLWRALPGVSNDRLFTLAHGDGMAWACSYPDYVIYRDRNQSFAGIALYEPVILAFGNGERSRVVTGELVTGNFFEVLGVSMSQGRAFLPEEDRTPGAHPVVVVGHDFWVRELSSDPQMVGKSITLNNHSFTVIGVAAAGFAGISNPMRADVWVPMMMQAVAKPNEAVGLDSRNLGLFAIGRLKEGASRAPAEAELETINRQLQQAYPAPSDEEESWRKLPLSLAPAQGTLYQGIRQRVALGIALATVVAELVLLIACANVANLLLARAAARYKEIAIRLAVGAGRLRLIRQLLTESLLLALLAAAAGSLLAFWINQLLMSVQPALPPPYGLNVELRLDGRALGFTLLLSILTSVIFGLAPAWAATRPDVVPALKDEPQTSGRRQWLSLRNLLVVAQVALSLVLLIGAGLFIRSLRNAQATDPGFDTSNGLVMTLDLSLAQYKKERGLQFYQQLVERLATTPGVRSITIANYFPLGFGGGMGASVSIEGQPPPADGRPINVVRQHIGLRYFETMGIPLLRGRDFTIQDMASSERVVIINETMARRHWPNLKDIGEVIGRRIRIGPGQDMPWSAIVGVAGDCKTIWLREEKRAGIWMPISQNFLPSFQALVRTNAEDTATISTLRREIAALDPNLPIKFIIPLREHVGIQLWPAKMIAALTTTLGGVGLLLAAIGLYGVVSYAVARRTREIGIRMALGAQTRDLLKMIIKQGMRLTLAGVAIGLAAAMAMTRMVASLLYGVTATDPVTFAGVVIFLVGIALLACYLPARRATKIDPISAARHE
ncbi:MAG: ABC transporter permease [Blastocatellia bacterium]|nr:ABC transporter permease [Blastocatellia bacterium]